MGAGEEDSDARAGEEAAVGVELGLEGDEVDGGKFLGWERVETMLLEGKWICDSRLVMRALVDKVIEWMVFSSLP